MSNRRHRFGNDEFEDGPLEWKVKKERQDDWSIARKSSRSDQSASADLFEQGYATKDDAMQVLWDRKERNAARIQATKNKLAKEEREQAALIQGIGNWTPPVIEDPAP